MKRRIYDIQINLKQAWLLSILFIACIPIFPEYFAPIFAVASLIAAAVDAKSYGRRIQIGTIGKLILLYIGYMTVGLIYSPNTLSTLSTVSMWLVMFSIYLSLTTVLTQQHRLDTVLFCVCLVAGAVGLIGIIQYTSVAVFGLNMPLEFWNFADNLILPLFPVDVLEVVTGLRPSSTFTNPNIYAEYLVAALPFAAYYAFDGKRTKTRLLCRLCFLSAIFGILFSFSRGSYIALIVVLIVFCIANIHKVFVIAMGVVSVSLFIPDPVISRILTIDRQDVAITERFDIWQAGLEQFRNSPVFGIGAGIENTWDTLLNSGINAPHMHNIVLQLLVEGGIISLGIMCLIGWKTFRIGWKMMARDGETRAIGAVILAFVGAFCAHSMVDFPLMTPKLIGTFIMVLGIAEAASHILLDYKTTPLTAHLPNPVKITLDSETKTKINLSDNLL